MSTPRTTAAQAPPAGRYVLDPDGSEITFVTRHMFGLARVRGRLKVISGVITIADQPENSQAEAEISASSFSTGNVMRDPQVRSRLFLDARRHPAISFRSDSVRKHQGGWSVAGFLEVKGRAAPIELNVTDVSSAGNALVVTASGTVDRYAQGITTMPGMAARQLSVRITARAARS